MSILLVAVTVRLSGSSYISSPSPPESGMRPALADPPRDAPRSLDADGGADQGNAMYRSIRIQCHASAAFACMALLLACLSAPALGANKYGARDPRTCTDTKAPAEGAITAALAAQYVTCNAEKVSGSYLYLVEDVHVEVGGGRPYNPAMDTNVPEIDVNFPLYAIRGRLLRYQCLEVNADFTSSAPGRNCNRTNEPQAKGFCYKTTFGDWYCHMADLSNTSENWSAGVAPPT